MPVYIQDVRCNGRELSILECGFRKHHQQWKHGTDVAVQCKKCKLEILVKVELSMSGTVNNVRNHDNVSIFSKFTN